VYLVFIFLDIIDSKIVRNSEKGRYRVFDTLGDRIYAYLTFIAFLVFGSEIYPAVIYIIAFVVRDLVILLLIKKRNRYQIKSNFLDRATMFLVAMLFLAQVLEGIDNKLVLIFASYGASALIFIQGFSKYKRIAVESG